MTKPSYDDLIFQLGDLAREHLAASKPAPRTMRQVFAAEDAVVSLRQEMATLDAQLNEEDDAYNTFEAQLKIDMAAQLRITKKYAVAVAGVESRSRGLKKKLSGLKAALRYQRRSFELAETKHADLEQREGHDLRKLATSGENLKKFRLQIMRDRRNIEEAEAELSSILTPVEGQSGAAGIDAHRRLLELEDEGEARAAGHDEQMKALDEAIAAKEAELKVTEEALDRAIFSLGEEVFAARTPHPALKPLYAQLARA